MSLSPTAEFFRDAQDVSIAFVDDRYVVTSDIEKAREIASQGEQAVQALCYGLSSIGYLIATLDTEDKGVDSRELSGIGYLIRNVADLTYVMNEEVGHLRRVLGGQQQ
jgi:hypothetical protein